MVREGGVRGAGGGIGFLLNIPGGEGPGGCLRRIGEFFGGGGLNIFFGAETVHQDFQFY